MRELTPHWSKCPALKDMEKTCHCTRRWIPAKTFPTVDVAAMELDITAAGVSRLRLAGKLLEHPTFGTVLAPENLCG